MSAKHRISARHLGTVLQTAVKGHSTAFLSDAKKSFLHKWECEKIVCHLLGNSINTVENKLGFTKISDK